MKTTRKQKPKVAAISLHLIGVINVFTKSYGRKPTIIVLGDEAYSILSREVEDIVNFKVSEFNPLLHFNGVEVIRAKGPDNVILFPFVGEGNFASAVNG